MQITDGADSRGYDVMVCSAGVALYELSWMLWQSEETIKMIDSWYLVTYYSNAPLVPHNIQYKYKNSIIQVQG